MVCLCCFLMIRRPPRSTQSRSSAASDVYKRQGIGTFTETAGSYSYTVTDGNGCTATTNVNISEPTELIASSTYTPILCNGGTSTVSVSASGGTTSYTGTGDFTVSAGAYSYTCLLYTSPSPRDSWASRMPSSAWKKKQTNINTLDTKLAAHNSHRCNDKIWHVTIIRQHMCR